MTGLGASNISLPKELHPNDEDLELPKDWEENISTQDEPEELEHGESKEILK